MTLQKTIYDAFYTPRSRHFLFTNDTLAVVTIVSITGLVLETVASLAPYAWIFSFIEVATVTVFTLEYLSRIYANGKEWRKYVFSFFGIIDLLAIIPSYLGLANLTFLKAARAFRILQLMRMMRIMKLTRRDTGTDETMTEHKANRLTLHIYFLALFTAVLLFGSILYIVESNNPEFANIPLAMLWTVKPLLGGIAQTMPTTLWGEIVVVLVRFVGLILFGLLISVVGNTARTLLFGKN